MQFNTDYRQFLLDLDKSKTKTTYARITALRFDESPIETIEGRVTQGSINLDGDSAVRRTCSLTLVANEFNYQNYVWGMNTKFKLEIGVKNNINSSYPDIIWFKQGIYLISSFNTARSTSSFTITIQGKDKMCQLNGEVGGSLTASVDFGTMEEVMANGDIRIIKIPIPDIIRNVVHQYAGEPLHNIVINDIEAYGLELLEYRYDIPMYLYRNINSNNFMNMTLNGDTPCEVDGKQTFLNKLTSNELDMLVETLAGTPNPKPVKIDNDWWYVAKVEHGHTAGYRRTDLTYPGDLIGAIGESITSILDKIKNMLGQFEYFYDLDGRFIFQQKQSFVNTLWSPSEKTEQGDIYTESLALASAFTYTFSEGELITAFNNNPNIMNMRNDYAIWGERTGITGSKIPVHMRYAIDKKPTEYTTIFVQPDNPATIDKDERDEALKQYNAKYGTNVDGQYSETYRVSDTCDWRELIYQMAQDYYKYAHMLDDFEARIIEANPNIFPSGQTGYESYYIDIISFWRQLYNPEVPVDDSDYYHSGDQIYWNKNVYEHPEVLNFWFDFLDVEGELSQYSVKNVGARTKSINDTNIKSIYFRETPNVLFVDNQHEDVHTSGYKVIQVQNIDQMFTISAQGRSAKDKLDELIYQHGYCTESATITTIPIYYLQPNIRVYVSDKETNLQGDYIISKMSIPLTYNGTMSLTATKAAETLF